MNDMTQPPTPSPKAWHSRGYLPHLDQPGAVQFITFRLADAVPADVVAAWRTELKLSGEEDADDPRAAALRKRVERYADQGHGACWLRDDRIAEVVQNALLRFDGERYRLLAWVIMPNHVHVLIETSPGFPLKQCRAVMEVVHRKAGKSTPEADRTVLDGGLLRPIHSRRVPSLRSSRLRGTESHQGRSRARRRRLALEQPGSRSVSPACSFCGPSARCGRDARAPRNVTQAKRAVRES